MCHNDVKQGQFNIENATRHGIRLTMVWCFWNVSCVILRQFTVFAKQKNGTEQVATFCLNSLKTFNALKIIYFYCQTVYVGLELELIPEHFIESKLSVHIILFQRNTLQLVQNIMFETRLFGSKLLPFFDHTSFWSKKKSTYCHQSIGALKYPKSLLELIQSVASNEG